MDRWVEVGESAMGVDKCTLMEDGETTEIRKGYRASCGYGDAITRIIIPGRNKEMSKTGITSGFPGVSKVLCQAFQRRQRSPARTSWAMQEEGRGFACEEVLSGENNSAREDLGLDLVSLRGGRGEKVVVGG